MITTKVTMMICAMALMPTRPQRELPSGRSARRAATGLVPMARFQASGFADRRFLVSKPTPIDVFVSGSASMLVIHLTALKIFRPFLNTAGGGASVVSVVTYNE